ncbi:MAG: DNA repair protein RadA, partial [Halobacteriales archaeon]|nr:DNA repair protein RadA [Halobacteriales archaeon]
MNRLATRIPDLDRVLNGGFPVASINIIAGQPGTGKTTLVQQIAHQVAGPDQRVLYLSTVNEPLHKMLHYVQEFAFYRTEKTGKD